MLRGPIEEKVRKKTKGRIAMKEFLEKILEVEEKGNQFKSEYRAALKKAVNEEQQMEG